MHNPKRIIVVTHRGALHILIRNVLGIPDGAPNRFELLYGALHTIVHRDEEYSIVTLGDMCHIEGGSSDDVESS